ncbi:MAG TPA: hypothetical protein VEY67_13040 [Candidatus Dormibacteraeota bacterium]|nr:hypothetical protein [Candidatus Dormibacteraeota bacterium]
MSDQSADPRDDLPEPGDSFALTPEGWQRVDYAEPGEGWRLAPDGSWESPDGQTRTWPLDTPATAESEAPTD